MTTTTTSTSARAATSKAPTWYRIATLATKLTIKLVTTTACILGAVYLYTGLLETEAFWYATLLFLVAAYGLYTAMATAWRAGWPRLPLEPRTPPAGDPQEGGS